VWTSTFGAGLSVRGNALGLHASMGLNFVPLGVSIVTFAVTIRIWRRVIAGCASVAEALIDALRVAGAVAVPIFLVSLITHTKINLGEFEDFTSLDIGPARSGALFGTLFVVFVVLALAVLTRTELFRGRVRSVMEWVAAGIKGVAAMTLALPVIGVVVAIVVIIVVAAKGNDSGVDLGGMVSDSSLNGHAWAAIIGGFLAYSGNIGFYALSLGALGNVGSSSGSMEYFVGLSDMTKSSDGGSPAFWFALLIPLITLAIAAVVVVRSGRTPAEVLRSLGAWAVLLLAAVPILGTYANLHQSFSTKGVSDLLNSLPAGSSFEDYLGIAGVNLNGMSGYLGVDVASATFLIFAWALLVGFLITLATGVILPSQVANVGRAAANKAKQAQMAAQRAAASGQQPASVNAAQQFATPQVRQQYQVGDVVNGHKFNGSQWVPYQQQYQVGDVVNGHQFNGTQWVPYHG
jgi:hypothetical protein